jgi:hypothetical protein
VIDILPARLRNILVVYESGFILGIFVKDPFISAALCSERIWEGFGKDLGRIWDGYRRGKRDKR